MWARVRRRWPPWRTSPVPRAFRRRRSRTCSTGRGRSATRRSRACRRRSSRPATATTRSRGPWRVAGAPRLSTTPERVEGYRSGLERNGLPYDAALVIGGGSQRAGAHAAALRLFALAEPPSALIGGNNAMTIGILHALRQLGRRVPA